MRSEALLVAAATAVLVGCTATQAGTAAGRLAVNGSVVPAADRRVAPQLAGTTLTGQPFSLLPWRGNVVVVNIWGSWCAPCKKEQPDLQRLARETRQQGVRFVGIDIKDNRAAARAHVARFAVSYPSIIDQAGTAVLAFGALAPRATPSTFVLDRAGRVAARFIGPTGYQALRTTVLQVLGGSP